MASKVVGQYAKSVRWVHWVMGGLVVGTVGTVKLAQWTEDKQKKGKLMHVHKSLALLVLAALPARIGLRLATKTPIAIAGISKIEHYAGSLSHGMLYACMTILPVSGVLMGYYGGKGLPFFSYHIPGAEKSVPEVAKTAFKIHKRAGTFLTYLLPIHVGAASLHLVRGHTIFHRINPFA